jgi:TfoX N-terminal domain
VGFDDKMADRVRRVLAPRRDVVEKRMVGGGLSFMVSGRLCCGVTGSDLMVRVGAEGLARALARPHVRPMVLGGRALKGFVCVDLGGCRTDPALASWVQRGIDVVSQLPRKKTAKKTAKKSTTKKSGKKRTKKAAARNAKPTRKIR